MPPGPFGGETGGYVRSGPTKDNPKSKPSRGSDSGRVKELLSLFSKQETERKGSLTSVDPFPEVRWISTVDNTRDIGDLEDRAARYQRDVNLVLANKDFAGFQSVIDNLLKEFNTSSPEANEIIVNAVLEGFERQLMEVVASANQLAGRSSWNQGHVEDAVSEESLTTAVGVRSYIVESARRNINNELKRLGLPSSHK